MRPRPSTLIAELSYQCPLHCPYCSNPLHIGGETYRHELETEHWLRAFREARALGVLQLALTGGEPMLRRDLVPLVKQIKDLPGFRYITVLTHGGFLTEAKIRELCAAGVNQINISMNYPDARQDKERGLPGLFERLESTIPKMVAEGYNVFTFASMLMVDNMHDAEPLVRLAHKWGINIAFSGYNDLKNGNQKHFVSREQMAEFQAVCRRLMQLKRELGNVMTSDYFFETLPRFYEEREIKGCRAGQVMIHVTPKGMVQPCAELGAVAHYSDFLPGTYSGPNCGSCFDACRSEVEAPVTLRRIGEMTGLL
jgi:pyrroloquinoline quinone biosynthesis protein E